MVVIWKGAERLNISRYLNFLKEKKIRDSIFYSLVSLNIYKEKNYKT